MIMNILDLQKLPVANDVESPAIFFSGLSFGCVATQIQAEEQ